MYVRFADHPNHEPSDMDANAPKALDKN